MGRWCMIVGLGLATLVGCGDDAEPAAAAGAGGSAQAGASGGGAAGVAGGEAAGSAQAGVGGDGGVGGAGGSAAGAGGSPSGGQAGEGGTGGGACAEELLAALELNDEVSKGEVKIVEEQGGVRTLAIDATAGGTASAPSNPRVYVALATGTRVDVTDVEARTSTAWDLAFKRAVVFCNSGDGGPAQGGAVQLDSKTFEEVTAADAAGLTFAPESFLDESCDASKDPTGSLLTSMSSWYGYDGATHMLSPGAGVFVVKGASGALFKLQFLGYYGSVDGGPGKPGANYVVRVAAL